MISIKIEKIPFKLSLFGSEIELELRKRNIGDINFIQDNLGILDAGLENRCKLIYRLMVGNSRNLLRNEIKIDNETLIELSIAKSAKYDDWYILYLYLIADEDNKENHISNMESLNEAIKKAYPEIFENANKKKEE